MCALILRITKNVPGASAHGPKGVVLVSIVICDGIFQTGRQRLLKFGTTQNHRAVVFLEKTDYINYM